MGDDNAPYQMLVSSTEQNDFLGKLAIGKVERGTLHINDSVEAVNYHDSSRHYTFKCVNIFQFEGLKRVPVTTASVGDIVCVAGSSDVTIGDTICASGSVEALPFVKISEPSVEMTFMVNDSPFAGKEGKFVTSRHLRERLRKETGLENR